MPRSKRAKVVHLSKVEKKGKELTLKTFGNVQACVAQYPFLYVFSVENMRNTYLKDVRAELNDSRLFFGKTKVMAKALGSSAAEEPLRGTSGLVPYMRGAVGLLFSQKDIPSMQAYASGFQRLDYARAGTIASRSFALPAGTLSSRAGEIAAEDDVPLAAGQEPGLRALGVPTRLVKGRVTLDASHPVCEEGDTLNSAQTTLLKMFGVATALFRLELIAAWTAETGHVTVLKEPEDDEEEGGMALDGQDDGDDDDDDDGDEED